MRAGNLKHSISIERETETVRPSGSVVKAWQPIATARAEVLQASADEFLTGFGEAEAGKTLFRIRWRDGITTADRVMFHGKAHNIKEIVEIGYRQGLELRCVA